MLQLRNTEMSSSQFQHASYTQGELGEKIRKQMIGTSLQEKKESSQTRSALLCVFWQDTVPFNYPEHFQSTPEQIRTQASNQHSEYDWIIYWII